MSQPEFEVPSTFAYLAVFLWALSGAIVGMHKRYDFAGVFVVALIASTGGGIIRDGIFLQQTPLILLNRWYIPLILLASCVVALLRQRIARVQLVDQLVSVIDALGVPAFAVVGMQLSLQAGLSLSGSVIVGIINGFGGGLLRDVVVDETPEVLKPGIYAVTALIFVCILYLALTQALGVASIPAAWSTIGSFFLFRMLSIRFNWQTRPLLPDVASEARKHETTTESPAERAEDAYR